MSPVPCNRNVRDQARQKVLECKARGLSGDATYREMDDWARGQPNQKAAMHAAIVQFADKILAEGLIPVSEDVRTKVGDALRAEATKAIGEKAEWLGGLLDRISSVPAQEITPTITTQNVSINQDAPRTNETTSDAGTRSDGSNIGSPVPPETGAQINEATGGANSNAIHHPAIHGRSGILKSILSADDTQKAEEYVWNHKLGEEQGWLGGQDASLKSRNQTLEIASSETRRYTDSLANSEINSNYRRASEVSQQIGADIKEPVDGLIHDSASKINETNQVRESTLTLDQNSHLETAPKPQDFLAAQAIYLTPNQASSEHTPGAGGMTYVQPTTSSENRPDAQEQIWSQEKSPSVETAPIRLAQQLITRVSVRDKKKPQIVAREKIGQGTRRTAHKGDSVKERERKTDSLVAAIVKLIKKREKESSNQTKKTMATATNIDKKHAEDKEKNTKAVKANEKPTQKDKIKKKNPKRQTGGSPLDASKVKKPHGQKNRRHAIIRAIIGMFRSDARKGTRKGRNGSSNGKKIRKVDLEEQERTRRDSGRR